MDTEELALKHFLEDNSLGKKSWQARLR
jgi:hypothetical protein